MLSIPTTLLALALAQGGEPICAHPGDDRVPPPAAAKPEPATPPPPPASPPADPNAPAPAPAPSYGPTQPSLLPDLLPDPTVWTFWWEHNRAPYLDLRRIVRNVDIHRDGDDFYLGRGQTAQVRSTARPSELQIRTLVVPALLHALETERNNAIIDATLIALAKIGERNDVHGGPTLRDAIVPFLKSGEQRTSETAALALGILGDDSVTPLLASIMRDAPAGRRLVGGKPVPTRTRAFAAYGLGLVGHRTDSNDLRRAIARRLVEVLELDRLSRPDLQVAAVSSLGIVPLDWTTTDTFPAGSTAAISKDRVSLLRYLAHRLSASPQDEKFLADLTVRAHAVTAAARLVASHEHDLPPESEVARGEVVDALLGLVDEHSRENSAVVLQSAVVGLGVIGNAATGDTDTARQNARIAGELTQLASRSAHNQTEYFALMALAQMGGRPGPGDEPIGLRPLVQRELLDALARGKGQKKPWAAVALGVYGSGVRRTTGILDGDLVEAVRAAAVDGNRPDEAGAYAIALGLLKDIESDRMLRDRLRVFAQDSTRGHIAVGLGLMQSRASLGVLMQILETSKFRPALLEETAIAIGLLGDRSAVKGLIEMLRTVKGHAAQSAVARALGMIGDTTAVQPLLDMLEDQTITDRARAWSVVALGMICDKDDLPWNTKIAVNVNYRAEVDTLSNAYRTGVLDIL